MRGGVGEKNMCGGVGERMHQMGAVLVLSTVTPRS
jgi:hypothetical protein